MRTVRGTCTVLIALAILAVPVATAAQSSDADASPTYSTATQRQIGTWGVPGATMERFDWGVRNTFGMSVETESTDPRVSGVIDIVYTFDQVRDSKISRGTGMARLSNEGGSWVGPLYVMYYPDGSEFRYAIMEGRGGYEGLTSTMTDYIPMRGPSQPQSLVWADAPPPVPDEDMLPE